MLRVGVIGVGTVAEVHISAFESIAEEKLVAVCDINPDKQKRLPHVPFYLDYVDMIEKENLDVVHICLPHYIHVPVAIKCLELGVNVLLEKPLGISYDQGMELLEAEKKSDRKIAICFQNRFNKTVDDLRKRIEYFNEEVKIVKGLVHWYRKEDYYLQEPWRGEREKAGGGTIINQAIHTLDLMQLVAGPWETCRATLTNLSGYDIEVEDTATANFTFANGITGYWNSTNVYQGNSSVELEVITDKHRYNIRDNRLYVMDGDGEVQRLCEDERVSGTKFYYGAGHIACIRSFYHDILNNTQNYATVSDALVTMGMIDAMKASSRNNQKLVKAEEIIHD